MIVSLPSDLTDDERKAIHAVLNELRGFGDTADNIATNLINMGIVGVPNVAWNCPLRNALKHLGYPVTMIAGHRFYLEGSRPDREAFQVYWSLPGVCRDFTNSFDKGMYPQLIDRTETQP